MNTTPTPRKSMVGKVGLVLLVLLLVLVAFHWMFGAGMMGSGYDWPTSFKNNGERIYFTGQSTSGEPIRAVGLDSHMGMMGGGCAACHGADRSGRRLMHRFWESVPALTPTALFEEGHGHGDHKTYTAETLKRAITQGINPDGGKLGSYMPRWEMTEQDLNDLIAYLKSPVQ